jgi:transposase
MVAAGAADPAWAAGRAETLGEHAGSGERVAVRAGDGLSLAALAEGFPAEEHGSRLFRPLELGRHTGPHPRRLVRGLARAGGAGGEPLGGDHRQPERQIGGKRGASIDPVGFDAGKKTKGIKRHVLTDHQGLLLNIVVHSAGVQDRDGAKKVLTRRLRRRFPFIETIYADARYQGARVRDAARRSGTWRVEIVKRPDGQQGFAVIAKRWIVERTLAWISRNRRLARDFENLARTAVALVRLAMIKLMLRRLAAS